MAPAPAISLEMDVKKFVVNEGHGVKGLADLHLRNLPEQFIQPPEERVNNMIDVAIEESIPILDVSNWDDPKVTELICNAAEKWGFFQIVNHGVPLRVLEDVKDGAYEFFGLQSEDKKKFLKDNSPTKNVRFGTSFNPQAEKSMEWKDYLSCYYVSDEEANALWPPACRNQMLEYMKRTESVITKILEALMKRLNVKEIGETMQSILMGSKKINLNYYPICPNPELTVGVGRHTDVSTLTILLQDETGGLYVRKQETCSWLHVPPVKGSLIVNIGDALQIMSNGRYKSVEHQVAANGEKIRISVPIFVNPRPTDVIGPLRQVLDGGEKAIYKRIIYSDYVKHFFRKSHGGKQTIEVVEI